VNERTRDEGQRRSTRRQLLARGAALAVAVAAASRTVDGAEAAPTSLEFVDRLGSRLTFDLTSGVFELTMAVPATRIVDGLPVRVTPSTRGTDRAIRRGVGAIRFLTPAGQPLPGGYRISVYTDTYRQVASATLLEASSNRWVAWLRNARVKTQPTAASRG
jgi:hypothetical protein